MSTEENKAIVRRWMEIWNTKDLGIVDQVIAPNFVLHWRGETTRPESGPEWYKPWATHQFAHHPEMHAIIEDLLADGDKVVCRWAATYLPPTGKKVEWTGTTISRLEDGKIAEEWWNVDLLAILEQTGVFAPPSS